MIQKTIEQLKEMSDKAVEKYYQRKETEDYLNQLKEEYQVKKDYIPIDKLVVAGTNK